ncbi:hypothetical protein [Catenovulum sediminis]|uniref:HDOD domain-containing protein n=1 Tax=Catenovulum sediminis TaxID=1740262 RepID=A0ABV1RE93_9ALTE|nr:hypothetical protein [Catenovulum sediminis]
MQHQKLQQSIHSSRLIESDIAKQGYKLSRLWLKLDGQGLLSLRFLFFFPLQLPLVSQRYLQTCVLILTFKRILNLHDNLVHKLLTTACFRDLSLPPKNTNKSAQSYLAEIHKSAVLSALQSKKIGLSGLSQLIKQQYAKTSVRQLLSDRLFNFACRIVNHRSINSALNWQQLLSKLCRQDALFIDSQLTDLLLQHWGDMPEGITVLNNNTQTIGYLLAVKDKSADIYQLNGHIQEYPLAALEVVQAKHKVPQKQYIDCLNNEKFLAALDKTVNPSKHGCKFILTKAELTEYLAIFNNTNQDPIDQLNKQFNKNTLLMEALKAYAAELSKSQSSFSNLRNAIMMLGLNRIRYWLARVHLENNYWHAYYDHKPLHEQYLKTAQYVASELAKKTDFIYPEQAKLLISVTLIQYLSAPQIKRFAEPPIYYSCTPDSVFGYSKQLPNEFIQAITETWQQPAWMSKSLLQLGEKPNNVLVSKQQQSTLSVIYLALASVGMTYTAQAKQQTAPEIFKQSLACLKLTSNDLYKIQQDNIVDNTCFNPLPRLIH